MHYLLFVQLIRGIDIFQHLDRPNQIFIFNIKAIKFDKKVF